MPGVGIVLGGALAALAGPRARSRSAGGGCAGDRRRVWVVLRPSRLRRLAAGVSSRSRYVTSARAPRLHRHRLEHDPAAVAECGARRITRVHQEQAFTRIGAALRRRRDDRAGEDRRGRRGGQRAARGRALVGARRSPRRRDGGDPPRGERRRAGRRDRRRVRARGQGLSGEEEARLAFIGAARTLGRVPDGALGVVDVGGGSSELVIGAAPDTVGWWVSFALGSGDLADGSCAPIRPAPAELSRRARARRDGARRDRCRRSRWRRWRSAAAPRRCAGSPVRCSTRRHSPRVRGCSPASARAGSPRGSRSTWSACRLLPAGLLILEAASSVFGVALAVGRGGIREGVLLEAATSDVDACGSSRSADPAARGDRGCQGARADAGQPPAREAARRRQRRHQVKAWWHVSAVNAARRLGMSDHSWVHIQIVLNIGLRLARLLFRAGRHT